MVFPEVLEVNFAPKMGSAYSPYTMVTGVRHNEQPGDLEAGEGAHVTVSLTFFIKNMDKMELLTMKKVGLFPCHIIGTFTI